MEIGRMEYQEFRTNMRRRGKKPHVIDGLIYSIDKCRIFLNDSGIELLQASTDHLDDFVKYLEDEEKGSSRKIIRGIALYYEFLGRPEMARYASSIREQAIAQHRRVFLLADFLGVDPEYVQKLEKCGIVDVNQMISAGNTPEKRASLSVQTGIPHEIILEYVKLADLTRIGALKRVRARLYYNAGLDTIDKIAAADPVELRKYFQDYVSQTGFDGIPPLPKEIRNTVNTAKRIERLVEF